MTIHPLAPNKVRAVATLMSTLKPEWWDCNYYGSFNFLLKKIEDEAGKYGKT